MRKTSNKNLCQTVQAGTKPKRKLRIISLLVMVFFFAGGLIKADASTAVGDSWTYTSNTTFTVPVTGYYTLQLHGGGGGGGGSGLLMVGWGGGGSGEIYKNVYLTKGATYSIIIGAGGAGGSGSEWDEATDGKQGGTTSFGSYSVAGGGGGSGYSYSDYGSGGAASGSLASAGGSYIANNSSVTTDHIGGYGGYDSSATKAAGNPGDGGHAGDGYGADGEDGEDGAVIVTLTKLGSVNVTWNYNGGTLNSASSSTTTVTSGATTSAPSPTRTGYTLSGWNTSASGSGTAWSSSSTITSDITYYAQWTIHTSTLKVNPNSGTWNGYTTTQSYTQNYNTTKSIPVPTRTGYTFSNWTRSNTYGTMSSTTAAATYTFGATNGVTDTITASWTANTYTVVYDGNGNTGGSTASSSHTYGTAKALTANGYTKTGYTFSGWNTKSDGTGTSYANQASVSNLTSTSGGTVTLYAQWTANTYTITWDSQGGSSVANSTQTYAATLTLPTAPTRTGYTFAGWYTAASGGTQVTSSTTYTTAGATTYYAHWTAKTYTITWDSQGGSSVADSTQTYAATLTLPTTPTRTGYTFAGWYTAAEGGTKVDADTVYSNAGNTTYYAQWVQLFSVVVPVSLPVGMDQNGNIFTSDNVAIVNNSSGDVIVSSIYVSSKNGWSLVSYDTNMAYKKVDSQFVGLHMNGSSTTSQGAAEYLTLTGDWGIAEGSELALDYDAVLSASSSEITGTEILDIVFVLEWD